MAREALCLALSASKHYEVVAEGDGADRVIVAAVQAVEEGGKRPRVNVALATEARDAETGQPLCQVVGRSSSAGHLSGNVSQATLVQSAVDRAAQAAVAQMSKVEELRGVVIETLTRGRARVSLGRDSGIVPGTEFAVYHLGQRIARIKAKDIGHNDANCYLVEQAPGIAVEPGDEVRVILLPEGAKEPKHRKSRKTAIIFGTLVAAGLTYMLVENSWKGHRLPRRTVQSVTADPLTIDGDGADSSLVSAVILDSDGQPVPDGTPVTFQIETSVSTGPGTLENTTGDKASLVVEPTTNGVAVVHLTSTLPQGGPDAIVYVRATSGSGTGLSPLINVDAPTASP
jgi:hypothetical protein